MQIASKDALPQLTKDDLWAVVENTSNSPEVRQAALELWLALDSQDSENSMKRMKTLIARAKLDFVKQESAASRKQKS